MYMYRNRLQEQNTFYNTFFGHKLIIFVKMLSKFLVIYTYDNEINNYGFIIYYILKYISVKNVLHICSTYVPIFVLLAFQITPTNCYLVSLAISDCLFFIAAAPTELSYLHISSSKYAFGSVGCAIFSYLPYLAINSSTMSITVF